MNELAACAYSAWYGLFEAHALRSVIIDLPTDFVAFLLEDGIVVGDSSRAMPTRAEPVTDIRDEDEYGDWSGEDSEEAGSQDEDASRDWTDRFPQLQAAVDAAILGLGGQAAPKLSWSAPTDAVWISSSQSMMCTNAEQVVLLLKSSDRAAHDAELAQSAGGIDGRPRLSLVLRKWYELRPEREFRCFVHGRSLVAVSQRDASQHFPQLAAEVPRLRDALRQFHETHVAARFPLEDYALDLYVTTNGTVKILDFNPISETTQPLLFAWDELPYSWPRQAAAHTDGPSNDHASGSDEGVAAHEAGGVERDESESPSESECDSGSGSDDGCVDFRVVERGGLVQPGARQACSMPFDMLSLGEEGALGDMLALMQQQPQDAER